MYLARAVLPLLLFFGPAVASVSPSAAEAHHHADQIDVPRFAAAFNDWRVNHPKYDLNDEGSMRKHFDSIDVKDRERYRECKRSWKALEKQMEQAGY